MNEIERREVNEAIDAADDARYALQKFSKELRDVRGFSSIHIDEFLTFADFFFDWFVMDVIVQSKISTAKRQCDDAIRQVETIRKRLVAERRQKMKEPFYGFLQEGGFMKKF